jgi:hypothetical protein
LLPFSLSPAALKNINGVPVTSSLELNVVESEDRLVIGRPLARLHAHYSFVPPKTHDNTSSDAVAKKAKDAVAAATAAAAVLWCPLTTRRATTEKEENGRRTCMC